MATKKKKGNTTTKRTSYQLKKKQQRKKNSIKKTEQRKKNLVANSTAKTTTAKKKTTTAKKTTSSIKGKTTKKKSSFSLISIIKKICKLFITLLKNIIKLPLTLYNGIKSIFKKKKNKVKKKDKKIKNKKVSKEKKVYNDDELHKLRYRDYRGLKKIGVFFINRHRVMKFDMKRFKKRFKYGTIKDRLLIILMLLLIAFVCLIIAFCAYIVISAPEITAERLYKGNATVLYDINGNEFARLGRENREKITYDELPEVLVDAIIATEDSRFFQHNGVDIARFTKAVAGQILGSSNAGGASTLTMQVSKNAATSTEKNGLAGIIRKFQDVYLSVFVFEKKFTKEQILEFYVNLPDLGAGAFGVEQASQTYFGKSVTELNLSEAALLAGLFQAPTKYNPYNNPKNATTRRKTVLTLMYRHGYITKEEMEAANSVAVEDMLVGRNKELNKYQGFIDTVVEEVKTRTGHDPALVSMKIYTTLNPSKQDVINDIYATYPWKNDVVQAGIAVISVKDGSIVAIGTRRNITSEREYNIATREKRHPGSTAKPVLDYGPAIEYLNWSTGQTIVDDKITYSNGASIRNWDSGYNGIMMAKTALAESRNIPALITFQQTTNEQKKTFSEALGWKVEEDGNGNILESCSIGGFDGVTPLESAAAYATFARGGTYIEPYSFTLIEYTETGDIYKVVPEKRTAMSEETAYMINMILKYAVTSGQIGTGSVSGTDICAKTGTATVDEAAKKYHGITGDIIKDSWENAYSPDYAISLWYGYLKISKEYYLTNSEGGTARSALTKLLVKGIIEPNSKFSKPNGVVLAEIEKGTDPLELASEFTPAELRSTEYFKKGTVPTTKSNRFAQLSNISNLKSTTNGSTVTLTWNAASIPDAINETKLKEYFSKSKIYNRWGDKYYEERLAYNAEHLGSFGYRVYLKTTNGLQELGFTTDTTFKKDIVLASDATFVVKTSYEKYPANMSTGVTVVVKKTTTPEPVEPDNPDEVVTNMSIEYLGPTCSTVNDYNNLGANMSNKFKVTAKINNVSKNITSSATPSCTCYNQKDEKIDCKNMVQGQAYDIKCTAKYGNKNVQKNISIKATC